MKKVTISLFVAALAAVAIAITTTTTAAAAELAFKGTICDLEIRTRLLDKAAASALVASVRRAAVPERRQSAGQRKFLRDVEGAAKAGVIAVRHEALVLPEDPRLPDDGDCGVLLQWIPSGDTCSADAGECRKAALGMDRAFLMLMREILSDKSRLDAEISLHLNTTRRRLMVTVLPDGSAWVAETRLASRPE